MFQWRSSCLLSSFQLSFHSFPCFVLLILTSFFSLSRMSRWSLPLAYSACFLSLIPRPFLPLFFLQCTTSTAVLLSLYLAISRALPIILCLQAESLRLIFSFSLGICESQRLAWLIDPPLGMDQSVYRCISFLKALIHSRWLCCVGEDPVWSCALKNPSSCSLMMQCEHLVTCNFC